MLNSLASSYILLFAIHPPISLGLTQEYLCIFSTSAFHLAALQNLGIRLIFSHFNR
jgi:hypothetical protein